MKTEEVNPNLRTMRDGVVDRALAKDMADAIGDWCFEEWLESLPFDLIVDRELLMLQFNVDTQVAQELLDLFSDALEPVEEFEKVDEGP